MELSLKDEQKFTRGQRKTAFPAEVSERKVHGVGEREVVRNGCGRVPWPEKLQRKVRLFVQGLQCHEQEYGLCLIGSTGSGEGFSAENDKNRPVSESDSPKGIEDELAVELGKPESSQGPVTIIRGRVGAERRGQR